MPTLNRNNSNWSLEERRKINENWDILEGIANSTASGNNGVRQELDALKITVSSNTTRSVNALQLANQTKITSDEALTKVMELEVKVDRANEEAEEAKNIAQGIEGKADNALNLANESNTKADQSVMVANEANVSVEAVRNQLNDIIADGGDSSLEIIASRTDTLTGERFTTLSDRLDRQHRIVSQRLNVAETEVNKKVDKIEGKGLSTNDFTTPEQTLVSQIPFLARQDFVNAQFASIVSGAPTETHLTLEALRTAHPNGASGIMLVLADGNWYYYNENVNQWLSGGLYQERGIEDNSVTKEKIDFILDTEQDLYQASYLKNAYVGGSKIAGATYFDSQVGRTAVIPVKSGETYLVLRKKENNTDTRFRIASDPNSINTNGQVINRFLKDETDPILSYDGNYDYFLVTVPPGHRYLYIYVTINVATLSQIPLRLYQTNTLDKKIAIDGVVESQNIVRTKNLFDGTYFNGAATGDLQNPAQQQFQTSAAGRCAIVKVKPLTEYSVSKTPSNRFRIAVANKNPVGNLFNNSFSDGYTLLRGMESDSAKTLTITTLADTEYLIVYVSGESKPPVFMQIEQSSTITPWERYGYKIQGEYAKPVLASNDDTELLKALFAVGGVVELDSTREYRITSTIEINPEITRRINGNGARIKPDGDFLAFRVKGKSISHAGTSAAYNIIPSEGGFVIDGLKIVPVNYYTCQGIELDSTIQASIVNCDLAFMKQGVRIVNKNRNVIISNSHIYAMTDEGIHFVTGGDIHQINILGNHIHWCKYNIRSNNHGIYNMQITGNDIEADIYGVGDSFPYNPYSLIVFDQTNQIIESVEIVGNTLEDHTALDGDMLVFKAASGATISGITLTGNTIGNSKNNDIYAENVEGLNVVGNVFKNTRKATIKMRGNIKTLTVNSNTIASFTGGFVDADCTTIESIDISHNVVTQSSQNPAGLASCEIRATTLKNATVADNKFDVLTNGVVVAANTYNKVILSQNIVADRSASKYSLPASATGNVVNRDNL